MAAYRRVYDSRHLQADCQERGSASVIEYGLPFLWLKLRYFGHRRIPYMKASSRLIMSLVDQGRAGGLPVVSVQCCRQTVDPLL